MMTLEKTYIIDGKEYSVIAEGDFIRGYNEYDVNTLYLEELHLEVDPMCDKDTFCELEARVEYDMIDHLSNRYNDEE